MLSTIVFFCATQTVSTQIPTNWLASNWSFYSRITSELGKDAQGSNPLIKVGECGVTYVIMKQKNTFTTGSFTKYFGTNPLIGKDTSVVNTTECVKANKYKK